MPDSTRVACTHNSSAGSLASYRWPVIVSVPVMCSWIRRTRAAARSAAARSPKVIVARYPDVAASLPTGSWRQLLCWSTPAIASGCSACNISARSPATGLPRSVLTRQVTLSGPKNPASAGFSGTPDTYAAADRSTRPAAAAYASAVTAPPRPGKGHCSTSYQPNYPPGRAASRAALPGAPGRAAGPGHFPDPGRLLSQPGEQVVLGQGRPGRVAGPDEAFPAEGGLG